MKSLAAICSIVVALAMGIAEASPFISIGDGRAVSWQDAINAGNIQPVVGPLSDQATAFYSSSIGPGQFQRSNVENLIAVPNVDIEGEQFDSLVMSWDPPDPQQNPNQLGVAAWEYVYDVDPDLSNARVDFSVGPPVGAPQLWDLSFELVDDMGRVKSWFLSMPQSGWQNYQIAAAGGTQGPWLLQGQTPGFDITSVIAIQFDGAAFNGLLPFPLPPPGTPILAWDWLPFNHLDVRLVPEPSTWGLAMLGLFGLGLVRRRNARRR